MPRGVKAVMPGVSTWAVFSAEKQLDFNGLHLTLGAACVLVDPVPFTPEQAAAIERLGAPRRILLTNKDHRRAAPEARARWNAPIFIHRRDADLVDCQIDGTFDDGELIEGALQVIPVADGKSPGESALHWAERRVLILGDALIGKPPGALSLLPPEKFADPERARTGAARLAELDVDVVLVGDGVSILARGRSALETFAHQSQGATAS
jgi:glyoxylase-like metal-dependent hydrolase (beta-lactamase superfamily II)